jgi:hypothetical protein
MKKSIILISCLLFSLTIWGKESLPPLELKLWNYIKEQQVGHHKNVRYIGGWPTYSRIKRTFFRFKESNSFLPAQLLIALSEVDQSYTLPGVQEVLKRANQNFDRYLDDAILTNEPAGTISYWPLLRTKKGKQIRSFTTRMPFRWIKALNLPNDLDASSQAFMWFYLSGQHSDYLDSFAKTVGDYLDIDRSVIHKNDRKWKGEESSGILTWAEPDRVDNSKSRIYAGVNDVDCVVNLNVLTALSTYQNKIAPVAAKSQYGMEASCRLLNHAVKEGRTNRCAVWYDRHSQFYSSYAKAVVAGTSCLDHSLPLAKSKVLKMATYLLSNKGRGRYTEIAEYISIIKRLWPPADRDLSTDRLLIELKKKLIRGIKIKGNQAYVKSKDSLFTAKVFGLRANWYSKSYSTMLALEALLLE